MAGIIRDRKPFRHCVDRDGLPSEEVTDSLHDVLSTESLARNRMIQVRARDYDLRDLLERRPAHKDAFSAKQTKDFVANVSALRVRDNTQVVESVV